MATDIIKKGYDVAYGYMGLVDSKYMLFASEQDYNEYIDASNDNKKEEG